MQIPEMRRSDFLVEEAIDALKGQILCNPSNFTDLHGQVLVDCCYELLEYRERKAMRNEEVAEYYD